MEWEVLEHNQGQCDEHGLFPADIWHDGVYVRTMAFSSVKAARDYEMLLNAPEVGQQERPVSSERPLIAPHGRESYGREHYGISTRDLLSVWQ